MIKALITIISICSFGLTQVMAQEVLMEQDVKADTVISDYGKNKKRYFGSNFGLGFVADPSTASNDMNLSRSNLLHYGFYYKLRANNVYSILGEAAYQRSIFSWEPTVDDVHYMDVNLNNVVVGLHNRINFGRRGNYIGYYFSFGASLEYNFKNKFRSKMDATGNSPNYKYSKVELHNLDYINRLNYNAEARIGFNKVVLFGKYRLSDYTNSKTNYEFPTTTIGLLFDFGA